MTHTEKLIAEVLELDAANRPHKTEETVWLFHIAAPKLAKALREALSVLIRADASTKDQIAEIIQREIRGRV